MQSRHFNCSTLVMEILNTLLVILAFGVISHALLMRKRVFVSGTSLYSSSFDIKPMKIALLVEPTPFNYVSGYANRFKETLSQLKQMGDNVSVVTTDPRENRPSNFEGFHITSLKGVKCPYYNDVRLSMDTTFKIGSLLRDYKPDVVHVSSPSFMVLPAIAWTRFFQVPLVMSYHTDIIKYVKSYMKHSLFEYLTVKYVNFCHSFADLTLCTSPQLMEGLAKIGISNIDLWRKGINTKVFNRSHFDAKMKERLSDGDVEAPLLLFVGRLGIEKRIDRLRNVLDKLPNARLAIVGRGPAEEPLKEHFKGYKVKFAGELVGEELSQAFASSDVFVMPSDTETLGFVVMEALASGVPAVAVNAGGLSDVVVSGTTGYLVSNSDDMQEFASCVEKLATDTAERKRMGHAAVEWAKQWSWEAATSMLRDVHYKKAIESHSEKLKAAKGVFRRLTLR